MELGLEKAIKEKISSKLSLFDITFSYYCHLGCSHCMYDCTPQRPKSTIKKENIFKYIDEAIALNKFTSFSFGDQEIFFNFDLFIEIAKYLQSKMPSMPLTITTSSYWVKNYDHALNQFSLLKQAGLKAVLLSIDDFHQRSIKINKVIDSIKASLDLGLELSLQTIISKNSRKKDYFEKLIRKNLKYCYDFGKVEWVEHYFTPVGRGKKIPTYELIYETKKLIGGCSVMEVIQIAPDGEVVPCCGSGACAEYLTIGNINKKELNEIITDADTNPLINSLFIWLGPYGLIRELSSFGKTNFLSKKHTGVCHACHEIFSNKECVSFLQERLDKNKIDLLAARWHIEQMYNNKTNN